MSTIDTVYADDPDAYVDRQITDAAGADLTFEAKVASGDGPFSITGTWQGAAGPTRTLRIPVAGLGVGGHHLYLRVVGDNDMDLGWVKIVERTPGVTTPIAPVTADSIVADLLEDELSATRIAIDSLGGGTADGPTLLPFAQGNVKTSVNNLVTYPTSGNSVTLHTIAGAGIVRSYQMTHAVKEMGRDGRLQIFVDGELTPSIDVELGTMFGTQDAALLASTGSLISTDHTSVSLTGTATYAGTSTPTILYPIPFNNGLVIKFYNPSVGAHSAPHGDFMFSTLQYEAGAQAGVTDTYRLRSASTAYRTPLAGVKGTSLPLFEATGIGGHLVYFSAAVLGATNYSFLERPWNVYVDGETEPSYRGNAEDWWGSGYYFGNMEKYSINYAAVTAANNASRMFCGAVDLLAMNGGLKFTTGLKMACGRSAETKGTDNYESTSFSVGFVALYYEDITPTGPVAVPGAPTSVVATAAEASASVSFLAPTDTGGGLITGYTVTSSPGGITATGSTLTIVVPGLTAGTPYTFTVKATNSAGQGPASSASNSVTPTAGFSFADDFNRANASTLGSTPTGSAPWTVNGQIVPAGTQTGKIVSNRAVLENVGSSGDNRVFATINTGAANYDVSVKIVTHGSSPQYCGLMVRYVDADNFVILQHDGGTSPGSTYTLQRKGTGPTYTTIGSTIAQAPADGDILRVVANGTNYKAYINGVLKIDATHAGGSTSAAKVGISAGGFASIVNTAVFDDFTVTVL